MSYLREKTQEKERLLKQSGYFQYISIWECQFRKLLAAGADPKYNPPLQEYLDSLNFE
jgi:hypothetical protein